MIVCFFLFVIMFLFVFVLCFIFVMSFALLSLFVLFFSLLISLSTCLQVDLFCYRVILSFLLMFYETIAPLLKKPAGTEDITVDYLTKLHKTLAEGKTWKMFLLPGFCLKPWFFPCFFKSGTLALTPSKPNILKVV